MKHVVMFSSGAGSWAAARRVADKHGNDSLFLVFSDVLGETLAAAGLVFRRRQFSLLAAAPGVGKSLFATNLSIFTKVPTLYLSADTDEWTVKQRACSILSSVVLTDVEKQLNNEQWEQYYASLLRDADHVDWSYQTDIDPEYIVHRIFAFAELRGTFPSMIVVDNLGNTVVEQDNEGAELRATCRELQRIARTTNAHVMALHHVKGAKENGTTPINLGDLLWNIGKIPEVVLGLHRSGEGQLTLTVPKYRGGKSGLALPLAVDYSRASIGGFR